MTCCTLLQWWLPTICLPYCFHSGGNLWTTCCTLLWQWIPIIYLPYCFRAGCAIDDFLHPFVVMSTNNLLALLLPCWWHYVNSAHPFASMNMTIYSPHCFHAGSTAQMTCCPLNPWLVPTIYSHCCFHAGASMLITCCTILCQWILVMVVITLHNYNRNNDDDSCCWWLCKWQYLIGNWQQATAPWQHPGSSAATQDTRTIMFNVRAYY